MKDEDCLFIISTVELKEKTEKDLMVEYEVYKLKYPFWANKSYERFCDFQKEWHWNKYSFKEEDNSYFTDIREAKSFVEGNFADINDGGIYDYALIKKVPVGKAYAKFHIEELYVFKYNRELNRYMNVELDKDEETKHIASIVLPRNS